MNQWDKERTDSCQKMEKGVDRSARSAWRYCDSTPRIRWLPHARTTLITDHLNSILTSLYLAFMI
jgi:hypothetical protein